MRRSLIVAALALAPLIARGGDLPPPPYALPTFSGDVDMTPPEAPYTPPRGVDPDRLFTAVLDCFPAPSWFRGELSAIAKVGTRSAVDIGSDGTLNGGSAYVGIVAKIPLYSPVEYARIREHESQRRVEIARAVAALNSAVTKLAIAKRAAALYRSLESRAAQRVRYGVADTAEQVRYVEAVAEQERAASAADAEITAARLTLVGMCADDRAESVDALIRAMLEKAK